MYLQITLILSHKQNLFFTVCDYTRFILDNIDIQYGGVGSA
jgi:hypothetical protein